jgi:hypothetical protein
MNPQMDLLADPLPTCPMQTDSGISIEPYPDWRFGFIDNAEHQFGKKSVLTRTRTGSDSLERLFTLAEVCQVATFANLWAGVTLETLTNRDEKQADTITKKEAMKRQESFPPNEHD